MSLGQGHEELSQSHTSSQRELGQWDGWDIGVKAPRERAVFNAGFNAALVIARVTAARIAAGPMPTLRREMAAGALQAFADEAALAVLLDEHRLVSGNPEALKRPEARSLGAAQPRATAIVRGYTGEACPDCGNFTFVRNGTCLKCDTCGATTGCS
ncbi:MAG: hypothetical protein NVS2B5_05750 [Beijerinckiaceae bacterium]